MSKYQTETDSPVIGFNIKVRLWKYNGAQSLLPCTLCGDLDWSKTTGVDVMSHFLKFDGILHIPSISDDMGHKAVKPDKNLKQRNKFRMSWKMIMSNCLQRF